MAPSSFSVKALVRPNIFNLKPYHCARDDYREGILLDANENAYGSALADDSRARAAWDCPEFPLARYPDPYQRELKSRLAAWRNLPDGPSNVFLGVGSDEVIDLVIRVCCAPGCEKILVCPPTYGMYKVSADINDVEVVRVPLKVNDNFQLDVPQILKTLRADPAIKVVFICSPGNPTGSYLNESDVRRILDESGWNGLVVVDEAYIDFIEDDGSGKRSAAALVKDYANLLVSQTFSKSFGMAGVRLGIAYSQPEFIAVLSKTKAPYNISNPTAQLGLEAMSPQGLATFQAKLAQSVDQRKRLIRELGCLPRAGQILGTSDANFVLVQILGQDGRPSSKEAFSLYKALAETHKVVVRFRGNDHGCEGCLRITVGTPDEMDMLFAMWNSVFA